MAIELRADNRPLFIAIMSKEDMQKGDYKSEMVVKSFSCCSREIKHEDVREANNSIFSK